MNGPTESINKAIKRKEQGNCFLFLGNAQAGIWEPTHNFLPLADEFSNLFLTNAIGRNKQM